MFVTQKRQLLSLGGSAKKKRGGCRGSVRTATATSPSTSTAKAESKKKGGCCAGKSGLPSAAESGESGWPTATSKKGGGELVGVALAVPRESGKPGWPKATKSMKFTGGDYLMGFKPDPNYNYETDDDPELIPEGALPEHRTHFSDIWFHYDRQLQSSNGMDLDTYPGFSMLADSVPVRLSTNTDDDEYALVMELINLALEIYNNDDSNVFKYKFLKIEKVNRRLTGYLLYFITVKFLNVTLGTVVETFQIYAGQSMCRPHQEVFSCVAKAGALM